MRKQTKFMKKWFLVLMLLLSGQLSNAAPMSSAYSGCIYTGADGLPHIDVEVVLFGLTPYVPLYVWMFDPTTSSYPSLGSAPYTSHTVDGLGDDVYHYTFNLPSGISISGCYNFYFNSSNTLNTAEGFKFQACLCPSPTPGCIDYDPQTGDYYYTLKVSNAVYLAYGTSIYTEIFTTTGIPVGYPVAGAVADPLRTRTDPVDPTLTDLYYDLGPGFDITQCYNIYYTADINSYNNYFLNSSAVGIIPPLDYVTVCPCCHANYTYTYTVSTLAAPYTVNVAFPGLATPGATYLWYWGDGTTDPSSGTLGFSHTYAAGGSYTFGLAVTIAGHTCYNFHNICFPAYGKNTQCIGDFNATIGNNNISASAITSLFTTTYIWSWGDGSYGSGASATHVYTASGTYHVCLTATAADGSYCTKCIDICIDIDGSNTGSDQQHVARRVINTSTQTSVDGVKLAPNPASDITNLSFNLNADGNVQVVLIDAVGRKVADIRNGNMLSGYHNLEIRTANLVPGMYTVQIKTDSGVSTLRLSVVK